MFFDILYFAVRHTPFWAIPFGIISAELVYVMWSREKRKVSVFFSFCAGVCLFFTVFYYWNGGPHGATRQMTSFIRYID
jgi:prolipoprotein diacylglyceryltransferase